ncbi:MAG TPA: DNA polymerase III subunit gamma/tau [Solirubrobacterales bacterium]|nr:DNA polymerase III subunit gamma/tau [Solirubrobacterales bacterium]
MPSSSDSISLYRRHRPGSFDEVVGQQHVVRTLRNAVEQGKVHHAYLFVGSRGTGKTSMAKILARSLNCERGGPTVTPCGECESCLTIAAGSSIDVIEMDAASNRSVDDVRDLRERVAYAPTGGRWKVYILDEAHMLTKEAWNAFLKTLEEPPPNTVFVLATTEAHKVMPTIADRCQRFDFQRPSLEQISEVLQRVAVAEGIHVEDAAVAMIARSASGSFRDALGTLDQLVAFGGEQIALEAVLELLGAADAELLFEAVDAVIAEDPKAVLLGVEKMARSGRDPAQFARDLLAHLRHLLVTQTVGEVPNTFVVTATDAERLSTQASSIGAATLVRTIDELANALTAVREGDDARMAVEIALLKAARPDLDPSTEGLLRRIERLEQGTRAARAAGPVAAGDPPPPAVAQASSGVVPPAAPPAAEAPPGDEQEPEAVAEGPRVSESEPPAGEPEAAEPQSSAGGESPAGGAGVGVSGAARRPVFRPEDPTSEPDDSPGEKPSAEPDTPSPAPGPAGQNAPTLDELVRTWPAVIHKLGETSPALAATFEGARPVSLDVEGLKIGFPAELTFNKRKAESADKRELMADALEDVLGERLLPSYVLLDSEPAPTVPEEAAPASEIDHDALVEKLKSEFDAEEVG